MSLEVYLATTRPPGGEPSPLVVLAGHAQIGDSAQLREILLADNGQVHRRVLVDLSGLSSMDCWTALILRWIARVLFRRGGSLTLTSPQPEVAVMLHYAGARDLLRSTPRTTGVVRATVTSPPVGPLRQGRDGMSW